MVNKKIKEEFTFKKGSFKEPFPHTMDIRNGTLAVIPTSLSPQSFELFFAFTYQL